MKATEGIPRFSLHHVLKTCLNSRKALSRWRKQQSRGGDKIEQELDIVNMIKAHRGMEIKFYSLLKQHQIKFANKLTERVLSEYSTDKSDTASEKDLTYVDQAFEKLSDVDLGLIDYY